MNTNKVDILAFGAHPDDVELGCGGLLAKAKAEGKRIAIVDLTKGEMGTRGNIEIRHTEAIAAGQILGAVERLNVGLKDSQVGLDEESKTRVVEMIRYFQPSIVIANAPSDRHPDHGNAAQLVKEALFLSGLKKLKTSRDGKEQEEWRVEQLYHYIQDDLLVPNLIVDISDHLESKLDSILAHRSQFFDANSSEPSTRISAEGFLNQVKARAIVHGHVISSQYGEGYITRRTIGVRRLDDLL